MDVSRALEISSIDEIKILQNVRLVSKSDLNPVYSKENLTVQFLLSGDIKGGVNCHLCLDGLELTPQERNYYFPLFIESMNILVGRQLSHDPKLCNYQVKLSPPKLNMNSREINTSYIKLSQKYELELERFSFCVLTTYNLEAIN